MLVTISTKPNKFIKCLVHCGHFTVPYRNLNFQKTCENHQYFKQYFSPGLSKLTAIPMIDSEFKELKFIDKVKNVSDDTVLNIDIECQKIYIVLFKTTSTSKLQQQQILFCFYTHASMSYLQYGLVSTKLG